MHSTEKAKFETFPESFPIVILEFKPGKENPCNIKKKWIHQKQILVPFTSHFNGLLFSFVKICKNMKKGLCNQENACLFLAYHRYSCRTCQTVKAKLKKCKRCLIAAYCNKKYQTMDCPNHKVLCGKALDYYLFLKASKQRSKNASTSNGNVQSS